jgi:alkylhydroperoxidase family enzyme
LARPSATGVDIASVSPAAMAASGGNCCAAGTNDHRRVLAVLTFLRA